MKKYRVDFSRLARDVSEIQQDYAVVEFLSLFAPAAKLDFMPEGHILDSMQVQDDEDLSGTELMRRHVLPTYPEAKLQSWDCWDSVEEPRLPSSGCHQGTT